MNLVLELKDNSFDGLAKDIPHHVLASPCAVALLRLHEGKTLRQWEDLGVIVFKYGTYDDESDKSAVFTLSCDHEENPKRTRINTHNCMGVIRLRDPDSGETVQIEVGSRFDKGNNQYFLAYLLSKVFGGSIIDTVDISADSLWDMLLAFVFRRRLLDAGALGLFKQYRTFHHNDARIRGRIDVDQHLRRNVPFRGNVAYSTHEISFDNPTNQLIRHALAKVTRKWGGIFSGESRLTDFRHQLEHNTPTWQASGTRACVQRKENRMPIKHPFFHATYEPLRQISLAILRDEGAGLYDKQQEAEGVIFDGSWLWEEYLWTLLKPLGFEHPENKKGAGPWRPLENVKFFPDFFHREKRIVLDAKYKLERSDNLQEDARQVFAYMYLLNAVHGGLIKPDGKGGEPQEIKRQNPDAEQAIWHSIALPPPLATTARDFEEKMQLVESTFKGTLCSQCGIQEMGIR